MNLCKNCGTQLNGQRFCPNCGAKADTGSVTQPPKKNSKKILFVIIALVLIIAVAGAAAVVAFKTGIVKLPVASVESDYTASEGKSYDSAIDLIDDYIVCLKNRDAEKMVDLFPEELINYYVEKHDYESKESYIESVKSLLGNDKEILNRILNDIGYDITESSVEYEIESMEPLPMFADDEWTPIHELFTNEGMDLEEAKEILIVAYSRNSEGQRQDMKTYKIKVIKIDNLWYLYQDWFIF